MFSFKMFSQVFYHSENTFNTNQESKSNVLEHHGALLESICLSCVKTSHLNIIKTKEQKGVEEIMEGCSRSLHFIASLCDDPQKTFHSRLSDRTLEFLLVGLYWGAGCIVFIL